MNKSLDQENFLNHNILWQVKKKQKWSTKKRIPNLPVSKVSKKVANIISRWDPQGNHGHKNNYPDSQHSEWGPYGQNRMAK